MNCDEVEALAGAYALGALSDEELQQVEAHLARCPESHASLGMLSETAALLPYACEPVEPPADLGERILAAARQMAAETEELPRGTIRSLPRRRNADAWAGARRTLLGLAAVLALLASGFGLWAYSEHDSLQQRDRQAVLDRGVLSALASGGLVVKVSGSGQLSTAVLVQPGNGEAAYLVVNWPKAAPGKSYEAWFITQGQPVMAGVFSGVEGGTQVVRLVRPLAGVQAIAFTLEPRGGSLRPTSSPFLQQSLS